MSRSDQHPAETVQWFKDVGRDYGDGASFPKFMANLRNAATNSLTSAEYADVADLLLPMDSGSGVRPDNVRS